MPARHRVVPVFALIALAATACLPTGSSHPTIRIELRDGALMIDAESAAIADRGALFKITEDSDGFVTFEVTNTGSETHQFVVVVTELAPEALPMEGDRVRLRSHPGEPDIGVLFTQAMQYKEEYANFGTVAPGETLSAIVDPPHDPDPRPLILLCNMPGHYHQGEYAQFIFTS